METVDVTGPNGVTIALPVQVASGLVGAGYAAYTGGQETPAPTTAGPDLTGAPVAEVLDYLANASEAERARVIAEEKAGRARKTIINY